MHAVLGREYTIAGTGQSSRRERRVVTYHTGGATTTEHMGSFQGTLCDRHGRQNCKSYVQNKHFLKDNRIITINTCLCTWLMQHR